jgi:hypothetical protein
LHRFYRASIRKACVHMLSTGCGEKNDAKLTAVCTRDIPDKPPCALSYDFYQEKLLYNAHPAVTRINR